MTSIRAHAVSDVGLARSNNQDSGYSGRGLYVVADGMGGHAGGDVASAIAVRGLAALDRTYDSAPDAQNAIRGGFIEAQEAIADMVAERPELAGMGTTVSAIAFVGEDAVITHIGDSRIYRLRDNVLEQITSDHTFVQRLVDTGRITPDEAANHPRRSVLMRVLGDIDQVPEVDSEVLETRPGDRWLLCSDGLSSYVNEADIRRAMQSKPTPEAAADQLLRDALGVGAPDNVTVVVIDIEHDGLGSTQPAEPLGGLEPQTVGSAAAPLEFTSPRTRSQTRLPSLLRHPLRSAAIEDSHFEPETDEYLAALVTEDRRRLRRRRAVAITLILAAIAIVVGGLWLAYQWTQSRFFVGPQDGYVAVFQGVQQDVGPISLHHLAYKTDVRLVDLPTFRREGVVNTISLGSLAEADATVKELRSAARD